VINYLVQIDTRHAFDVDRRRRLFVTLRQMGLALFEDFFFIFKRTYKDNNDDDNK
jgi:hypothetical protein